MSNTDVDSGYPNTPAFSVTSSPQYRLQRVASDDSASAEFMRKDLARSGLTQDDIAAVPLALTQFAADAAAYRIPYFGLDGTPHPKMHRVRYAKGDRRYGQPGGKEIGDDCRHPYIPPRNDGVDGKVLAICEGEKKAACVRKYIGIRAIGIGGACNWRNTSGKINVNTNILAYIKKHGIEEVLLIPDADVRRYDLAREYGTFALQLSGEGIRVELLNPPGKIDDLIVGWGAEHARGAFAELRRIDSLVESAQRLAEKYGLGFTTTKNGAFRLEQNLANVLKLLQGHRAFPSIWYNLDTSQIMFDTQPANMDHQGVDVLAFLQHNLQMPRLDHATVRRAITRRAYENQKSPFRDWLEGLQWDGMARLPRFFSAYCGSPDNLFNCEVGEKWLAGAVWRTMQPGCPVDYMLITKGSQGIGKSTLPVLVWGAERVVSILGKEGQHKDNVIKYHAGKCISFEEFDAMYIRDIDHLKGVITNRRDTFRKPYDTDALSYDRSSIFYASTNKHHFLKRDDTGYRRFVVVQIEQVDFTAVLRDRDQLWAEAVDIYRRHAAAGTLFQLSEISGATEMSKDYAHEEDFISQFDEWKANALNGTAANALNGANAKVKVHAGHLYLTAPEAYGVAGIDRSGKLADKLALKDHMFNTGWTLKDKWKEIPDKIHPKGKRRLEKVFIHPIST